MIQAMQNDITERQQERIVKKFWVLFHQLSKGTTKYRTPPHEYDMRMKFFMEKLTDTHIMTPKVHNELKILGGAGKDPVESMIQMLGKYQNVEITLKYRHLLECQWKYL